jgi:hypothetical protein
MRWTPSRTSLAAKALAAAALMALMAAASSARADEVAQMSWEKPIQCLTDGENQVWRVQCDKQTKVCLYAPDAELDSDGSRLRPLDRVPPCEGEGPFDQAALQAEGYRLELGVIAAPYGWLRDRFGRIFQTNFDLHRRMYVGGSWAPESRDGQLNLRRSQIEFGLLEYQAFTDDRNATRHRLRLLEGEVRLAPFSAQGYLIRYDISHRRKDPLLRVTTFLGEPRRSDYKLNMGFFLEGGGLEVHNTPQGNATIWRYGTAHLSVDLWQSRDLYSFVRLRGGGAIERLYTEQDALPQRDAFTPGMAVDGDFTLDRDGFHHITVSGSYDRPQYYDQKGTAKKASAVRGKGELGYEIIMLSLNDQPISLRVSTSASRRDDIPGLPNAWVYTATAGLRLSLWAPARDP